MQKKAERQSDHYKKQMLLDKEAMLLGFSFSGDDALIRMALKSTYDKRKRKERKEHFHQSNRIVCTL